MRIGFDATAIPARRAGAGNYIYHLIHALWEIDRQNEYFVFAQEKQKDDFPAANSNFQIISTACESRPARLAWEQTTLPRLVRQLKLDVLHSPHYTMPLAVHCKSVVTFHDMTFFLLPGLHKPAQRFFFRYMIKWSAHRATKIITVSDSTRRDTIRCLHVPPEKLTTIPLAANQEFQPLPKAVVEQFCARHGLTPGQYICFVGVLEPRKGVPVLIRAFKEIANDHPDVTLVIAGRKGWMYDEIFQESSAISQRIRLMGYMNESDLIHLINGARVFVYPSLYEGFGLPVLEGMQCGVPVITTDISSLPEVAGGAALLARPGDVASLKDALIKVLTQNELARSLSERGIARAKYFDWKRSAAATVKVYESAVLGHAMAPEAATS
jgi:glycosyltransferase involved in cell wall biosynthesis